MNRWPIKEDRMQWFYYQVNGKSPLISNFSFWQQSIDAVETMKFHAIATNGN
jgi:hypothetical protein